VHGWRHASDHAGTLVARREFEQEVYYYQRAAPLPGSAPISGRGPIMYGRDMVGQEAMAAEYFQDVPRTIL